MTPKSFIDRHYNIIRKFRFLYGWAKDGSTRLQTSARVAEWKAKGFRGAKLDICGGRNPYKPGEFLNVDIVSFPQVDLAFDIRKRFPFDDGVIAEIISIATLEHLRKPHVEHLLRESFRVLMPGGRIRVSTPDIEAIAAGVVRGDDSDVLNQQLFGKYKGDDTQDYDVHRSMYRGSEMIALLEKIGFVNGERLPVGEDILHDPLYTFLISATKPQ